MKKKKEFEEKTDYLGSYYGLAMWGNEVVQAFINDLEDDLYWTNRKYRYLIKSLAVVGILLALCTLLMIWR